MRRLAVLAHFDEDRRLRTHTRRLIVQLDRATDGVVVVSTSGIIPEDRTRLPPGVRLIERENVGYDFYSYKVGLDALEEYWSADQVVICNDSFVGPIVPLAEILESPAALSSDLLGMTVSEAHVRHVQSYFMIANKRLLISHEFRDFWSQMTPISDRFETIRRHELGLSRRLSEAGFVLSSYFAPSSEEFLLSRRRYVWYTHHRLSPMHPGKTLAEAHDVDLTRRPWNPAAALADRILLGARLPVVKLDTLRFDPYALGAQRLLAACERVAAAEFEGVQEYLTSTRPTRPTRTGEENLTVSDEELTQAGVGYVGDSAFEPLTPSARGPI